MLQDTKPKHPTAEVAALQAWITATGLEVRSRVHQSVVAFENNLPQPLAAAGAADLAARLSDAHHALGRLTLGRFRPR